MNHHENQQPHSVYKVSVYSDAAFMISYVDSEGQLLFSIEVNDTPKTVFLNPSPSESGRMADLDDPAVRARVNLALKRVKAYFTAQGLTVQVD